MLYDHRRSRPMNQFEWIVSGMALLPIFVMVGTILATSGNVDSTPLAQTLFWAAAAMVPITFTITYGGRAIYQRIRQPA